MDDHTADKLRALNNAFYRSQAQSFSQTRQYAWKGWGRIADDLPHAPGSVLDVACGNMRFKDFLDERFAHAGMRYCGVDSCAALVAPEHRALFLEADVLEAADRWARGNHDLVACFGFMHHVPGFDARVRLLDALLDACKPGGTVAVSFWRFASDAALRSKAEQTTAEGCAKLALELDGNDFLLGWNGLPGVYRYCHSFTDLEIEQLVATAAQRASLADTFREDGKTHDMNTYIVLGAH